MVVVEMVVSECAWVYACVYRGCCVCVWSEVYTGYPLQPVSILLFETESLAEPGVCQFGWTDCHVAPEILLPQSFLAPTQHWGCRCTAMSDCYIGAGGLSSGSDAYTLTQLSHFPSPLLGSFPFIFGFLHILDINFVSVVQLSKIFSHSVGCLFTW